MVDLTTRTTYTPTITEKGQIKGRPPSKTEEVPNSLSLRQAELNSQMHCPAGKGQAYVSSRMRTNGRVKKEAPGVCLDCKIRNFLGWTRRVKEETVRTVCCGEYTRTCEAWTTYMNRPKEQIGLHMLTEVHFPSSSYKKPKQASPFST